MRQLCGASATNCEICVTCLHRGGGSSRYPTVDKFLAKTRLLQIKTQITRITFVSPAFGSIATLI